MSTSQSAGTVHEDRLEPAPGRHVTRRLEEPRLMTGLGRRHAPGAAAMALVEAHNLAVRRFGSDCGGWHAFDVPSLSTAGVWRGHFPEGTVVSRMSWGRIDPVLAQYLLEGDRWIAENGSVIQRSPAP